MDTAVLRPMKPLGGPVGGHKKRYRHRKVSGLQQKHYDDGPLRETQLDVRTPAVEYKKVSSSLPLGQLVSLSCISGATYVTAQLLVQQVAYKLSDKIFSYSPDTFDLDVAAKEWAREKQPNIHGHATAVMPLQTRTGAGIFALGYIFSPDFDLRKRHIPQALLASSASLRHLRPALDQLSLLYGVANPFVAHVAAADYSVQNGMVAEYQGALQIADELGFSLVSSSSAYEAQHMSILATLIASVLPTMHIYDGLRTSRDTLRVIDTLSEAGVAETYKSLSKKLAGLNKRLDDAGKVLEIVKTFNGELGTSYEPFEYHGHESAETVLVAFGSVEAQLAKQVILNLVDNGERVGAINVRVYRPFIEEAFLAALPASVRQIAVLGQVREEVFVEDVTAHSVLFSDVLTAVSFSSKWAAEPAVLDLKYAASEVLTPSSFASKVNGVISKEGTVGRQLRLLDGVQQYTLWDLDKSAAVHAPAVVASVLARESSSNIYLNETHDNLIQGGIVKADIRVSQRCIDAPYPVEAADVVSVGDEKLLKSLPVLDGVKQGGKVILRLPNFKDDDLEKRIDPVARRAIAQKSVQLHVLDSSYSPALEKDARLLLELAFLRVARPEISPADLGRSIWVAADQPPLIEFVDALDQCLRKVEVPSSWSELGEEPKPTAAVRPLTNNSFVPFDKAGQEEPAAEVADWQRAAKSLAFKELYATKATLRPDVTVPTWTVHVRENRRLTPLEYERNIFHIEFDIGDSGLKYNIGEALGIHADNDAEEIREFIDAYGLEADGLVQVPSRENPSVWETRTVFQSLVQNVDILGKPPQRFYESLASHATDEQEKRKLEMLGAKDGAAEFKKRADVDTVTYVDVLHEFGSARPAVQDLVRMVAPLKRREYSIASAQTATPTSVALMIVVVDWVDTRGRTRYGQASRYLARLPLGAAVTVSVKPSVMKLPARDSAPLIMAGLGTGLAPFRAFVQHRALQRAQGRDIGAILLYLGSRHRREEYLYGEEWEAYLDAGVVTLLGAAFSRDQPQKIYIQDRMRQTMDAVVQAYLRDEGSFYLCGPTWPVPDVTEVLQEAIAADAKASGRKVDPRKEIDRLKENGRYVLEVY